MMCTIYDAISNKQIARGRIAKTDENCMVLHNSNNEVQALLNVEKQFKLITDDGSYSGTVIPWKMSKSYLTVKLEGSGNRDKRKYLRMACDLPGKVYSCGAMLDCDITELAYGSCMIKCKDRLFTEEDTTVQIKRNGSVLTLNGTIKFEKTNQQDEDDLWFSGYDYMVLFDEGKNLENTMDELYGTLLLMLRGERERASAN